MNGDPVCVTMTAEGICRWKLHSHTCWELMIYFSGNGRMHTENGDLSFGSDSIIAIPPGLAHGSVSENGFRNISVAMGSFQFSGNQPVVCRDSSGRTGLRLAKMIYQLYYEDPEENQMLLSDLISALGHFTERQVHRLPGFVHAATEEISRRFADSSFQLCEVIAASGYNADYFRSCFRKVTGQTPNEYLIFLRLRHAEQLMLSDRTMSIVQVAHQSGFQDELYFSRLYRKKRGISPSAQKQLIQESSPSTKLQQERPTIKSQ